MSDNGTHDLDALDWAILEELQENARLSYAEIGRRVGLSAPAVTERVKRLEESGVIGGYTTRIRPEKVGLPVAAFIRIRFHGADLDAFFERVRSHRAVSECHRVTGSDDVVLRLRAASVNRLEEHLDEFLDYGEITTSIVLSSAVEDRPIHKEATPNA
jgi:Lrp/AsnC family leucine-responsive transcriptional regulator